MTEKTVHVTKNGIKRALSLLFALLMLCSCASVAGVGSDSTEPTATERVTADRIPASTAAEPEPESSEPITSEILSETVVTEYETSESLPDSDTLPPFDPEPITVDSTAKYKNYKSVSDARIALYDYTDDELLFQNGLTSKIYPASVTKLFTVTYARTILDLDHVITVGDEIFITFKKIL